MERSSFDKFIGGTEGPEGTHETIKKAAEGSFESQYLKKLQGYELVKTEREFEMIESINDVTDRLREKYGLSEYQIPAKNFHIIKQEGREAVLGDDDGKFEPLNQAIIVTESESKTEMVWKMLHEAIHFKSFQSMQIKKDTKLSIRRVGLTTAKTDPHSKRPFTSLNEAITEELTKRGLREISQKPFLAKETYHLENARQKFGDDIGAFNLAERYDGGTLKLSFIEHAYKKERKGLSLVIDKLVERNPDSNLGREAWFDMFASAAFTGHLIEIGREVEKAFGKGAFRKLSEENDPDAFLAYAESL